MLEHGGRLRAAAQRHGRPVHDWVDLSTGINPHAYPLPGVPAEAWQRLPEDEDGLDAIAADYYGCDALLPVAGSQAALQALPALLPGRRVTIPAPTYAEHPHAWRHHALSRCAPAQIEARLADTDILLLVHPNNPDATRYPLAQLLDWHARLAARGGTLIVDEAFVDATPEHSLLPRAGGRPGLVVLRSLGKFFGLAGARVGFVFAEAALRQALQEALGPWSVAGPARWAAAQALADRPWQATMRQRLQAESARLAALLAPLGTPHGTPLFQWLHHPDAAALAEHFAAAGILVRRFDAPASLRFGLPADEAGWQRLAAALHPLTEPAR